MKSPFRLIFTLFLGLNSWLIAETDESRSSMQPRSPEQLEQILGPIALYPDALIGLILPASTFSSDVVLAARYLNAGGDPGKSEEQPWEDSVQGLAHYPDVIKWMDENLAWTIQLGEVFIAQPEDVMATVQRLRLKAQSAGTLTSTPQQQVVVTDQVIEIVPTQPDVIYVPYYDPAIVYVRPSPFYRDPFFTFSAGFGTGAWLAYEPNWRQRNIIVIDRPHRGLYWRRPGFPGRPDHGFHPPAQPWRPAPGFVRPTRPLPNHPPGIVPPRSYHPRNDQRWNRSDYPQRQPGYLSPAPRNPGMNRPPANPSGNAQGPRDRDAGNFRPRSSNPPPKAGDGRDRGNGQLPRPRPENNNRTAPAQPRANPPPSARSESSPPRPRPAAPARQAPEQTVEHAR